MSFTGDIKKFNDDFGKGVEKTMRGTAIALFRSIIFGSPVDEGRFRGNWFVSGAQPSKKITDRTDKSGTRTAEKAANDVEKLPDFTNITLTNNLEYSIDIEFGRYRPGRKTTSAGFSKQAPKGVLRVNVKRFEKLIERFANRFL